MNTDKIKTAIAVLDHVSKEHLRVSAERNDLLKDSFRRDGLTLNSAAAILESYLQHPEILELASETKDSRAILA